MNNTLFAGTPRDNPTLACVERETLGHILRGAHVANALMSWGRPAPIELPTDCDDFERLLGAHAGGFSATVTTAIAGHEPKRERLSETVLAAFCPAADGRCRWVACDLDAAEGHGRGGLADPLRAARAIVQAGREHGLDLLVVRSGSGRGCHVWALLPEPCPLSDAVLGIAALAADGFRFDRAAFVTGDGRTGGLGAPGCVELIPRSTDRPRLGWPLTLPFGGVARARGGGIAIDPNSGEVIALDAVPLCDAGAWLRFVADARARRLAQPAKARLAPRPRRTGGRDPLANLDARTADFLAGRVEKGGRNRACFAAACSLLRRGVPESEAVRLIHTGAAACGLGEREARTTFASACGAIRANRGRR